MVMATTHTNTSFRFDIAVIDDQHQHLIDLLDRLGGLVDGQVPEILEVLDALRRYTVEHFSFEEQLMRDHGFPEYESHRHEHEVFEAYVKHLYRRIELGKAVLRQDVQSFLKVWLTRHIQGSDRKYAEYFRQRGVVL
ncbi:hypothetical protein EDM80_06255 [bacterium]|nr:MAG: hypothetical protein EDM80_06255 [bacterium]RIK61735.1 MAG: hypothetical protein DCC64_12480 [Planctomycetota bacterium]